ncbi:MAG: LysR family transcriptional regulator [Rhizobiaceae bacterium]|nr:LysR family transcriptional regulator [Rhizobiaceae bacterium]
MSLNSFHLNGLRALETVARRGSLAEAARELGVSPSAVSQQINRAEAQLGQPVFERLPGGLRPTAFGRDLIMRLGSGFRELEAAVALADRSKNCTLVVSVAPALASKWLLPRLSRHFQRHPEVLLRIDATKQLVDPDHSDVDVAIRMGTGNWPGLRAEPLLPTEIFPVCAPSIAASLRSVGDLARTWLIDDEASLFRWEDWFAAAGEAPVTMLPGARFTDPMLCLDSVIAGHGVMLAWQTLAADALADGRLVMPFPVRARSPLSHWLVTSATRRESRKVTDFKAWLREEIATTVLRFETDFAAPRP